MSELDRFRLHQINGPIENVKAGIPDREDLNIHAFLLTYRYITKRDTTSIRFERSLYLRTKIRKQKDERGGLATNG